MPFTVLGDRDVKDLLHSLDRQDILDMQQSLADALHHYSASYDGDGGDGEADNGCAAAHQPRRTVLARRDGRTTLVMPASSNDAMGVKVVTLGDSHPLAQGAARSSVSSGGGSATPSIGSLSLSSSSGQTSSSVSSSRSSTADRSSAASGAAARSTPASTVDGSPGDAAAPSDTAPRGTMTLYDGEGTPRALLNAEELTAFRTALASTCLFKKRRTVHDVTVFGAGRQAYWHLRLALLLRGAEVHHVNVVNRSFERARALVQRLAADPALPHRPKVAILTPDHAEYERLLKTMVRSASVIFCTTPATQPLFPATHLTNPGGRLKGRYVAAIGSYKPHMVEIHPDIVRQAVAPHHGGGHHHKHPPGGGAVVVDSVESCLREAGELIQAGLGAREVVELGELVMLKRDAEARRAAAAGADNDLDRSGVEIGGRARAGKDGDGGLREWLEKGNVIYKSVGLGLMDVVVGGELVRLADERNVGTRIAEF